MAVRLARIGLTSADPERLAAFYEDALGFERIDARRRPPPSLRAGGEAIQPSSEGIAVPWIASPPARNDGVGSAPSRVVTLRLGREIVDLTAFNPPGAPYPGDVPGWSPLFQHFAIVVSDMAAAYARLFAQPSWRPISTDGPQILPETSGGVTAFKFRDPEGHPLEFLAFPESRAPAIWNRAGANNPCLGIDHSAISVAATGRSVRFYESLGCMVGARSHNVGPEQARLDGLECPDVAVTGLSLPGQAAPHIELLCYRGDFDRSSPPSAARDIAGTRLVLAVENRAALAAVCETHSGGLVSGLADHSDGSATALLRDPDGYLLLLTTEA